MWKRHFWSLFYHNTRWKKYFFEKSKKSQFFKIGRRPSAGYFEFFQTGGRSAAGLDFGSLVSEKVKNLKSELFERFSIKSGLTDVWNMSMLYHWMKIHLRITFFGLQNQNLIFCKTGRRPVSPRNLSFRPFFPQMHPYPPLTPPPLKGGFRGGVTYSWT